MTNLNQTRTPFGKIAAACAIAIILAVGVAGTAKAAWHDDDWRRHETSAWRYHHDHPHRYVAGYVSPPVYAPPVIVAAPPPPSSGINLVIPFNIR